MSIIYLMAVRILCIAEGYLVGCFLTAVWIVRRNTGKEVWTIGTGNPGMANVMDHVGKREGVIVLAGDILKTLFSLLLAWLVGRFIFTGAVSEKILFMYAGTGCVLGHNYPFWHGFKGGKGVTVTCTVISITMHIFGIISCLIGGAVTLISGYLPTGALVITVCAIPFAFWMMGPEGGALMIILTLLMALKHFSAFISALHGNERRFFRKS